MTAVVHGNHGNHKSIHKDLPNVWFRDLRNRISPIASLDTTWLLNKSRELSTCPTKDWPNPSANHSGWGQSGTMAANPCSRAAPDLQTVTGPCCRLAGFRGPCGLCEGLPSAEMKLVLLLCFVAKSLGISWKVLEVLHWAASHVFIGAEATEPTIWCNAKGQPATCQVFGHRAWSPCRPLGPLGAAGSITEPHRASPHGWRL